MVETSGHPDIRSLSSEPGNGDATSEQAGPSSSAAEASPPSTCGDKARLTKRQRRWARCEAGAWVLAAAGVLCWGDGHDNVLRIVLSDDRVRR